MGRYNHYCDSDYRNDGWGFNGTDVDRCWKAWNNDDDTKYTHCPSYKGRAAVRFPINITALPEGSVVTSVSVYLRARKTDNVSRSITVNVISADDTSKFTSRTLYLTDTPTTYEVGTYTKDPLGNPWDIFRINQLIAQVYVFGNVSEVVEVFKFYFVINYRTKPTVEVTDPTGVQITASPEVAWTYSQDDGDLQALAEYKIFTANEANKVDFNPDVNTPVYEGEVEGDLTFFTLPTSLDRGDYYVYVRVRSAFNAVSDWSGKLFTIQPQLPGIPGLTATPDNTESKATLDVVNQTNLMSFQQSSAENADDKLSFTTANCTLARTRDEQFGLGTAAYAMTSTGGNMTAQTAYFTMAEEVDVVLRAHVKSGVARSVTLTADFFDESYDSIGTPLTVTANSVVDTWTEYTVSGATPTDALYCRVTVEVDGTTAAEVHYFDALGLMYGTDSLWSVGGHMSRNILTSGYSAHPTAAEWSAATGTTLSDITNESRPGSDSPNALKLTAAAVPTSISFVAAGTVFSDNTSGSSWTLNKPATVAAGDLMLAYLGSSDDGTLHLPDGWTLVNRGVVSESPDAGLWVLSRVAEDTDPATWTVDVDQASTARQAVVVAYRGAGPLAVDAIKTTLGDPAQITTPDVTNTDANSWRVSAFLGRDSAGGTLTANEGLAGTSSAAISFVDAAPAWRSVRNGIGYKVYKPNYVETGDLMVCSISVWGYTDVTPPTGWRRVEQWTSTGTYPTTLAVMVKDVEAGDPDWWDSVISTSGVAKVVQCVAYRGAAPADNQFIDFGTVSGDPDYTTDRVTTARNVDNDNGQAWRIYIFAANDGEPSRWSSTQAYKKADAAIESYSGNNAQTHAVFDSDGPVPVGGRRVTARFHHPPFASAVGFSAVIKPSGTGPAPGAAQTERSDAATGTGSSYITLGAYDSGDVIPVGDTQVTGTLAGTGSVAEAMAGWVGIITPGTASATGEVKASMATTIDIHNVVNDVWVESGRKITMTGSFVGSVPGTSFLTLEFYRANELLAAVTKEANSFNVDRWMNTYAVFDMPEGTTHIRGIVSARTLDIGDSVDVDRIGVLVGDAPVWRPGTYEAIRSVWSTAILEYTEREHGNVLFNEWKQVYGTGSHPPVYDPLTGRVSYVDHTLVPRKDRKYRAATIAYGLDGNVFTSDYSDESDVINLKPTNWWLKDVDDPTLNMALPVKWEEYPITSINTTSIFQPLGTPYPVVLTEGFKSDTIEVNCIFTSDQWYAFKALALPAKTLFLQNDVDQAWWVRLVDNLEQDAMLYADRQNNPLRVVKVMFAQVAPKE